MSAVTPTLYCTLEESVDLSRDYFAAFGLSPTCELDLAELANRYRQLQQAVHPDRFLRECDRSQRLAQQQAAYVNQAYATLKQPLTRAQYLLQLAGRERAPETTLHDPLFLMEQIALRERLDEAQGDLGTLDALYDEVSASRQQCWQQFAAAWQAADWPQAQQAVDRLQFAVKLLHEIEDRQARLED